MSLKDLMPIVGDVNFKKSAIIFGGIFVFGIMFGYVIFPALLKTMIGKQIGLKPGSEIRELYTKVPFPIDFKIYLFNITNKDEVTNGAKPRVQEIGPYVFEEWKEKFDMSDNAEDDTLTFNMKNTFIFRPDLSNGLNGNEIITTVHSLIMGMALAVNVDKKPMLPLVSDAINGIFHNPTHPFWTGRVMDYLFDGIEIDCSSEEFAAKATCSVFETGEVKAIQPVRENTFKFSLPFLPEGVNNATLLNILNAGHDGSYVDQNDTVENAVTKEDFKEKKKKPRLDDDENHEHNPVDNDYHEDKIDGVPTVAPEVLSVIPLRKVSTTVEPATSDDHDDLDLDHTIEPIDISTEDQILSETTWRNEVSSTTKNVKGDIEVVDMTTVSDVETEKNTEVIDNSTEHQINETTFMQDKENASEVVTSRGEEEAVGSTEMPNENTESIGDTTDRINVDASKKKIQNESNSFSDDLNDIYESNDKHTKGDLYEDGYSRINDNDLKVVPLAKQNRKSERIIDVNHSTVKPNELDDTNQESSTGHFLDEATFQSINESIETSRSSDNDDSHNNLDNKNKVVEENVKLDGTIAFSRCTAGQFECANGTSIKDGSPCIALNERCDNVAQCTDNSDEAECERLGCPGHFQCNDGTCLARHLVCDGKIKHCNDGSDELNCDNWKCHFDEIYCSSNGTGPCLPSLWQCDGLEHCLNGADETNCPGYCKNNEFFCSVQRRCIPETWKCDGEIDCMEDEDERLCDCPLDSFRCHTGGGCIPLKYVCDGNPHCADFSDEWKCFSLENMNANLANTTEGSKADWETSETHKIVGIKKPSGQYLMVCATHWNSDYSNHICSKLGFGDAMVTMQWPQNYFTKNDQNSTFFRLRNSVDTNMLANLYEVDSCDEGVVAVQCEEFECGKSLELDALKGHSTNSTNFPSLALAVSENVRCTATIVAPKWALASYSCVMGKSDKIIENEEVPWTLYVGGTTINESFPIVRIFKYPQAKFKHFFYSGDAVLLELQTPLKFSERVSSACLSDNTMQKPQICMVAGFGFNSLRDLQKPVGTELFGSSNYIYVNQCNSSNQFAGSVSEDAICSEPYGSYVNDTCYNDEGSPLLCFTDAPPAMWTLQGILSYHGNCGEQPESAVYSSVPKKLLNWIVNTIGNEAIVKKS